MNEWMTQKGILRWRTVTTNQADREMLWNYRIVRARHEQMPLEADCAVRSVDFPYGRVIAVGVPYRLERLKQ